MAKKEHFYQTSVDRTPYGACATVGIIGLCIFIFAGVMLVRAGAWIEKHVGTPTVSTPTVTVNPFSGAEQQLQNIKDTAQSAAASAAAQQVQAAQSAAASAAASAADGQIDSLKSQVTK